jgi:hypothetical protein
VLDPAAVEADHQQSTASIDQLIRELPRDFDSRGKADRQLARVIPNREVA